MAGAKKFRAILPHERFRDWPAYRCAEIIYDTTVKFCERFVRDLRMRDQMVQAARSGKQNIGEGSAIPGVSRKTELKRIGVARASLMELLLDYEDYLRQHKLADWPREHPTKKEVRRIAFGSDRTYKAYRKYIEDGSDELAANTIICLIYQTRYLLGEFLQTLEQRFLDYGGFTENLHRLRLQARGKMPVTPIRARVRSKTSLDEKFALIREHWRPKVVAELNGQELKLAKFQGSFPWHHHEHEDELFLVWRGEMVIEFRDRRVTLNAGEFCVVPRGVEHRTMAEREAEVLVFEPAETRNTGNIVHDTFTAPNGATV